MATKWNIADLPKPIQELIGAAREYNKASAARRAFDKANPEWWKTPVLNGEQSKLTAEIRQWRDKIDSAARKVQ